MRLPTENHAGQGAGDAVHHLDAGDHQLTELIQAGRLDPGDDVVGPVTSSATCTPSRSLSAWPTWATLPTSVRMSTQALSIRADLLGGRCHHPALTGGSLRVAGQAPQDGSAGGHRTGGPVCGIVGAGGWGSQPVDRHGQPAAARSTAAWHTHVGSGCSRREGPNGPDEGGEPCRSGES